MRTGKASNTAEMVAVWRALADAGHTSVPGFSDPYARQLLSRGWARVCDQSARRIARQDAAARVATLARYDFVILRVATLDRLLREALAEGARQLVILGAGFDTRAWRLPELAEVTVYEVDHPATQAVKQARAAAFVTTARPPTYVPVDFARDALGAALAAAGHDAAQPTVWLWEGVVMYLVDDAVQRTLSAVRERATSGDTLLVHYHTPEVNPRSRLLRRLIFSWLGEPQLGQRTPEAMAALVSAGGFEVARDLSLDDQAALVGATAPDDGHARVSRILVARAG